MSVRQILSAVYRKLVRPGPKMVRVLLFGKELVLYEGTVHKADKDDAWFFALANHSNILYDIGCNIGSASVLATVNDANKTIVLADPNPMALRMAAENLVRNNLSTNKMFIAAFVGERAGEQQKFYTVGAGAAGSMFASHAKTASKANAYYDVDTTTIDKIVQDTGLVPDLVKIDVEGAESMALNGAVGLAKQQVTKFMVEMHGPDEMPMPKNAALVLAWCLRNGYTPYYLSKHVELTTIEQLADRGRCHLLLLPAGMAYPAYLKGIAEGAVVSM